MRRRPLSDGYRLYLTDSEYETVIDSAPDRRTRIAMRIAGECSPRIGLLVEIQRSDFFEPADPDIEIVFLEIREGKDTTEDGTGGERITWVPRDLYDEILDYCQRANIHDDEELFDIGAEHMRNKIKEAGANAAAKNENSDYRHLTPHDLRAYFATSMIRRKGVDKEIVKSMGGWDSDKALQPYLDVAHARDIQNELSRQGLLDVDVPTPPGSDELGTIYEEVREIRDLLKISEVMENHDVTVEQLKQAESVVDDLDGGNSEPRPTSLDSFSVTDPATAVIAVAGSVANETLTRRSPTTDPPAPHLAETAMISAIGVLFVIYTAGTAGLSTAAASAAVYGGMIPLATAKTWWDALRGG